MSGQPPIPGATRVVAIFEDLLLGSNVLGMLRAAGYAAELSSAERARLDGADVVIADLAGGADPAALKALAGDAKVLGVYSHVHVDQRANVVAAGFDMVVPRSRMAREGPALVHSLLSGPTSP